jgi:diguanylate cyclase (GGDEF)-like protein/PAS domain S-box-containing protein
MNLFRLTITQRLWLGLGLLLALFAAADLVSLRATHVLDETLSHLVTDSDERTAAAYEMNVQVDALARAIDAYMQSPDPAGRDRIKAAQAKFERGLARYKALAMEGENRAIALQLADSYARYRKQSEEVTRLTDVQLGRVAAYQSQQHDAARVVQEMPDPGSSARGAPPTEKRNASLAMAEAIQGAASLSMFQDEDAGAKLAAAGRNLAQAAAQYQRSAGASTEREWLQSAQQWWAGLEARAHGVLASHSALERGNTRLQASRSKLDIVLNGSVQPAAKAELKAAMDKASGTVHRANLFVTRGLLLALVLGVLAALAIGRAVKSPLRALVASSKKLAEGEFSHRVASTGDDELSALTAAFNEMAARLQATTVSRTYMESVVNSMGEALLVVSDDVIKTANPAAAQLLGYQPGELNGKPLSLILPDAGVQWSKLPPRFTADLAAQDGTLIPVSVSAVPIPARAELGPAMVCVARDLRERIAADHHQRRAAVVFENTQEGIILTDAERNVVMVNPAFNDITGYRLDDVLGKPSDLLWANRRDVASSDSAWASVATKRLWQGEMWLRRQDGELKLVWVNISVVKNAAGRIVNYVLVFSDITAIKDAEERLNYLAYHDALTDLPNRSLLADRVRTALSRAERTGTSVALLYLDLDDFKHVNDTLGHEQGDKLLNVMAARFRSHVRDEDSVARLGGDEFVIVLEDVADPAEPARLAEKLLAAVSEPIDLGGLALRMRASIGIGLGPAHGTTSEELLKAADAAMYRAKRAGRGRYEFFSAELTRHALERLTLENAMRDPRFYDQLLLYYQPQVAMKSGRLVGAEALLRWQHPTRGLLAPSAFIQMAEDAGLIPAIGEWVLRKACRQAKQWADMGLGMPRIAVNVSSHQINAANMVEQVQSALAESGIAPGLLELEVTEGALQTGAGAVDMLSRLKALGVRLALDDFGTGYSTLSSLKLLPFDQLKIDRAFVHDV